MNLEKIKKGAYGGLAAIVLGATTGCETPEDRFITGLIFGGVAPYASTPQASQALGFAGSSLVGSATAQMGKSEVNVNISPEKYNTNNKNQEFFDLITFCVGYWADGINGGSLNEKIEIPNEIVETNRIDISKQDAVVYVYSPKENKLSPKIKLVIEDLDGKKYVDEANILIPGGGVYYQITNKYRKIDPKNEEIVSKLSLNKPMEVYLAKIYVEMHGILNNFQLAETKTFCIFDKEKENESEIKKENDGQNKKYEKNNEKEI